MDLLHPFWLLAFVIGSFLISLKYWRQILFIVSLIFHVPIFLEYFFLSVYARFVSRVNRSYLKKGRYTIWFKRQTSVEKKLAFLGKDLVESIKKFVLGEDSMIVLQKVGDKVPYVPKSERDLPKEEQTVFYFEKLPREKIAEARDNMAGISDEGRIERLQSASVSYQLTLRQLAGWDNMGGTDGVAQVPFKPKLKKELYDQLPIQIQDELESEFGGGVQSREEEAAKADSDSDDEDVAA